MTLASPRLPFSLIAIFAGGLLRATRFSPCGHYEPEGLYTLCGSNCEMGLFRQGCTSSASALNTCSLSLAYPQFGWVTSLLWYYTL